MEELSGQFLKESVSCGRFGGESATGLQLEQLGGQVLCVPNVVEAGESVAQSLSAVKVESLRFVERQAGDTRPRRLCRCAQDLEDPFQLISGIFHTRESRAARQQFHKDATNSP